MKSMAACYRQIAGIVMAAALCACSGASGPDGSAAASNATAAPSAIPTPSVAAVQPAAAPSAVAPAEPPAAASATASAAAEAAPAAPSASAAPEEAPIPSVKVKNIGMHIGGGPNDDVTKGPIKRSVEPHFDAFRRCFAKVDDPAKGGDFGVDVLIEANGGKAKITHPRTALKGAGFEECVVSVFEAIEFLKPKGGKKTMVSYSLRFTP
ncbi:MAG: hypothetical protein IPM54_36825 [Polyangiaceae bacterium]|nr:hypothetical protein [Polyangiaceae bacterium]